MTDIEQYSKIAIRAQNAANVAHGILSKHESSQHSRAIVLADLLVELSSLPVDIQDYFKEAIGCVEYGFFRAAHVFAWAGFVHVLTEKMYSEHYTELQRNYSKWSLGSITELKENTHESQLLEAARKVNLISKNELKQYLGFLVSRNQCAHPTMYKPNLNITLGFVEQMIQNTKRYL